MEAGRGRELAMVAAARLLVSGLVLALGFRAVSDDDYARTVIAQRFAESPSWDPSGTSWLPLPFWIHGGAMQLFGTSLGVARATALLLGIAASLMLHQAGLWSSGERRAALAGALLACLIPYFALLGVATVPEAFSAAAIVLGAASLSALDPARRWLGAGALGLACLSRYEAWPVAAGFVAVSIRDALATRRTSLLGPALAAALPMLAWLLHGSLHHQDATFFLTRVAAYKRALGGEPSTALDALLAYPLLAIRHEPEIVVLGGLGALLGFDHVVRGRERCWLLLAGLLAFLCIGALYDGVPTHHAERVLLPLWLWAALVAGSTFTRELRAPAGTRRRRVAGAALSLLLGAGGLRLALGGPEPFVDRSAELEIGTRARQLVPAPARLAIDTPDYGFFSVTAAFGSPARTLVLDARDPREPRAADPFVSRAALRARLEGAGAGWLVASGGPHATLAAELGPVRARNARFVLVELAR